jgi:hypothetical protein
MPEPAFVGASSERERHDTPDWEPQSNFRLTSANLKKAQQLREKSRRCGCRPAVGKLTDVNLLIPIAE